MEEFRLRGQGKAITAGRKIVEVEQLGLQCHLRERSGGGVGSQSLAVALLGPTTLIQLAEATPVQDRASLPSLTSSKHPEVCPLSDSQSHSADNKD